MNSREQLIQSLIDDGYLKTPRLIEAFRAVDRADFILPEYKAEAYENYPLPIGGEQTISQPLTVAFMLESLEPQPGDRILDIGAGSGWQTALLAQTIGPGGKVDAVEIIPELCEFGEENVKKYSFIKKGRARFYCQDASAALPEIVYDKIIAAAASSREIPELWRERLRIGGKIVAPIGGSIWLFIKKSAREWEEKEYPGFTFVPLIKDTKHNQQGIGEFYPPTSQNTQREGGGIYKNSYRTIAYWLLTIGLLAAGALSYEIYIPQTSFNGKKTINIGEGLGLRKIGEALRKEGVIRSKWLFVSYATFKGVASSLKPGIYVFFADAALPEITRDLVEGTNLEKTVTIPEGWTAKTIATALEREGIIPINDFLMLTGAENAARLAPQFQFLKDKPAEAGLEGYLFPDTYRFHQRAPAEEIISKMLANFDRKLSPELRQEAERQDKTLFEIIVLASLIEKEVISEEDRALVSGILRERLRLDIPLQTDATITFITGKKSAKVSIEETRIDSPYNTYKYKGLPKGPIANPGISAIRAAIYPQKSPYLYYLSTPDGRTIFSGTLEEHNTAKANHLR